MAKLIYSAITSLDGYVAADRRRCSCTPGLREPGDRAAAVRLAVSSAQAARSKRQDLRQGVVVAVDVKHISAMLLGTRGDEQVRNGKAMLAACGQLALSPERDRERLGIHPQVAELVKVIPKQLVVAGRPHAVLQLKSRDRAQTQLIGFRHRLLRRERRPTCR